MFTSRTRFLLTHPGIGSFVQQIGRALWENGLLARFATTLFSRVPLGNPKLACPWRRALSEFPADLVTTDPGPEILRLVSHRVCGDGALTDVVWEWSEHRFDRQVARRALPAAVRDAGAGAVWGFEHACLETLRAAKANGLGRVLNVSGLEREFVQGVWDAEIATHPELSSRYYRHTRRHGAARAERCRQEWALADVVVVHSRLTRDTYEAAGCDAAKVRVVPLGAPPPVTVEAPGPDGAPRSWTPLPSAHARRGPVRFLCVGATGVHKGVHHLLAAWRKLRPPSTVATLQIIGRPGPGVSPRNWERGLPVGTVEFTGAQPRAEVERAYRESDVLVFPTLGDGFGMVVTEAWSHGLPVITTTRAGASELVRPGENGLLVPPADAEALAGALAWCLDHRDQLPEMGAAGRRTAAGWQWGDFRRELIAQVFSNGPMATSMLEAGIS